MINSVYYGLKQKKYAVTNYHNWNRLNDVFYSHSYSHSDVDSEYVKATITSVKAHMEDVNSCKYVTASYKTVDRKVFLDNKFSLLLDKEQKVTIGDKTGVVIDKIIDISNDTAYYYTNIVAELDDSNYQEGRKKEFEHLLKNLEEKLKRVLEREEAEKILQGQKQEQEDLYEEIKIEEMKAMEEQDNTFMGKIIRFFKGE